MAPDVEDPAPPTAAEHHNALSSSPAAPAAASPASSAAAPRPQLALTSSAALLRRYQHYAATLGKEVALLLLCHGSSALAAAICVSYRLAHALGMQLRHWLNTSQVPQAAVAVLSRVLRSLRALLQQYVAGPLGRLLTQLVWVQIQLSTDDVLDEGTRLSARLNSCVSLLFGSIRLRSHSCLQLAAPSRQPMLAPEFSLSSPGASPTKMMAAMRAQQQQQERQLLRSASTPTPQLSSPRFAQQQPAGTAATSGGGAAAPPPSNRRRTGVAVSPSSSSSLAAWGDLSQAERASVARALRSSQHPGQGSADAEVHVLCSSELKTAILAFLQAHSRRNGSEFVLLRNFNTSTPPTPTADTPLAVTPTATAAAAAAAAQVAAADPAAAAEVNTQQAQRLQEATQGAAAAVVEVAGAATAAATEAVAGFGAALGFDAGSVKPQPQQLLAQIYAFAADGSSGGGSNSWSPAVLNGLNLNAHPLEQQQRQEQQQQQWDASLPVFGTRGGQPRQQEQQQEEQLPEPEWGTPRGSLTLAEAWDQVNEQQGGQQQQQQQQQQHPAADVAGCASDPTACPTRVTSIGSSAGGSGHVLATAAHLLAAAAEALGDERLPGSPHRCDASPQKAAIARAAAAAATVAAARSDGSVNSAGSGQERTSFVSAADKFRSLAASAASADGGSDLCSKPLMAFSRRLGAASPGSPSSRRSSGSSSRPAPDTGSSLYQQEQYARLYPPGSRSFEALSLRNSGGKSPLAGAGAAAAAAAAAACHGHRAADLHKKGKKLPAAPFSLSASLPLSLDGHVLQESG